MKKLVIVSGYFNPLHKGHIEYFKLSKYNAEKLFVIINNDFQRKLKGSKSFMLEDERFIIINELRIVDKTFMSIDKDKSVNKTIKKIHSNIRINTKYTLLMVVIKKTILCQKKIFVINSV